MRDCGLNEQTQTIASLNDVVESLRHSKDSEGMAEILSAAAALVEHVAYVVAHGAANRAPTTHMMLLAASIESVAKDIRRNR